MTCWFYEKQIGCWASTHVLSYNRQMLLLNVCDLTNNHRSQMKEYTDKPSMGSQIRLEPMLAPATECPMLFYLLRLLDRMHKYCILQDLSHWPDMD